MAADDTPAGHSIPPIDWEEVGGRRSVPWRLVGFVLALAGLALYRHHVETGGADPLAFWPSLVDWVFRLGLIVMAFLLIPPLVRNPDRTRRYWRRLKSNRLALAALVYLVVFFLLGWLGPGLLGRPRTNLSTLYQPPAFFEIPNAGDCVGPVVERGGEEICKGTLKYPLGTWVLGQDMVRVLVAGMRVTVQMAVISSGIIIPVGTAVGVTAGYVGGRVDDVLMRYVDVQQSIPAFVVYIILLLVLFSTSRLLLLAVVFGLFNWGSIARVVRSEVIQRRDEQYVDAARSAGLSHFAVVRRHVLPNVSNAVLVGATQKIPQLVLIEAGLTYIELGTLGRIYPSLGETIRDGIGDAPSMIGVPPVMDRWWIWLFPVILLVLTVVSLNVVGDALRDVLDPRGDV